MSNHGQTADVAVPEITLGSKAASVERIAGIIGIAGLLLCVAGLFHRSRKVFPELFVRIHVLGGFSDRRTRHSAAEQRRGWQVGRHDPAIS